MLLVFCVSRFEIQTNLGFSGEFVFVCKRRSFVEAPSRERKKPKVSF